MSAMLDSDVLIGFIEEVEGYLPLMQQGIETLQTNPTHADALNDVHRYAHTIKGAAAMVGLTGLNTMALYLENAMAAIAEEKLTFNDDMIMWVEQVLIGIETYLQSIQNGDADDSAELVNFVAQGYEKLKGVPGVMVDPAGEAQDNGLEDLTDEPTPVGSVAPVEAVSRELMQIFQLEAGEHIQNISLSLVELEKKPDQLNLLHDIRRSVHTLKGAASTIGLQLIADLSHRMEDLLDQPREHDSTIEPSAVALLLASVDVLEEVVSGDTQAETLQTTLQEINEAYEMLLPAEPFLDQQLLTDEHHPPNATEKPSSLEHENGTELSETAGSATSRFEKAKPESSDVIRVPIERLDELIRLVGELVITRTTFEQIMGTLANEIEELQPSIDRMRRISTQLEVEYEASTLGSGLQQMTTLQWGNRSQNGHGDKNLTRQLAQPAITQTHDFDELEFDRYTEFHLLSRALTEATSDLASIGNSLRTLTGDFDGVFNQQSRLSSELQEKLMRTRMIPLSSLAVRLHRVVRVVAQQKNKLADLTIDDARIELDKTVFEEIADPLLHLLRNAVDHGLESPAARKRLGKPERGQIHLRAYHEGNQVVIQLSDDGAGLNYASIRAKAVSHGYISESQVQSLSENDLQAFLFLPGFSTALEVSEVSGRGVGLDVVKANINKLKGTVILDSVVGEGTTFTIRLPMTLAVTRALLVKAYSETFAIPLNAITQIVRLKEYNIEEFLKDPVLHLDDEIYSVVSLGETLQLKKPIQESEKPPAALILETGGQSVALIVDDIVQGREVVIKTLGSHLRYVHGVMGATLMGDGSVVLILNPAELVRQRSQPQIQLQQPPRQQTTISAVRQKTIMIVDDSISIRRVVSKLIENAGWRTITAKDGLDALQILQQANPLPDLILLDVEMPRMDGYELTSTLKAESAYQNIPIVMLTSRAGEKHRHKAFELGVSDYVIKPYQEENLLNTIRHLTNEPQALVSAS